MYLSSSMILDRPSHFGQIQIRLFLTIFYNLDLSKMIWTQPKQIGLVQNNWYSIKMIWTRHKYPDIFIKFVVSVAVSQCLFCMSTCMKESPCLLPWKPADSGETSSRSMLIAPLGPLPPEVSFPVPPPCSLTTKKESQTCMSSVRMYSLIKMRQLHIFFYILNQNLTWNCLLISVFLPEFVWTCLIRT